MKRFSLLLSVAALVAFLSLTGCSVNTAADIEGKWTLDTVAGVKQSTTYSNYYYEFKGGKAWYNYEYTLLGSTTTYKSSEGTYTVSAGTVELSGVPGLLSMKYNAELKDGVLFLRDPNNYDATASLYSFKKK